MHQAFLYIPVPSLHDYNVKCLFLRSGKDVDKQHDKIFFSSMNLDMVDRNSTPEEFACIWKVSELE